MSYKHINTLKEKFSDIELNRAFRILEGLESNLNYFNNIVIYASGNTYKKEDDIKNIEKNMSVKVIINESLRKGMRGFIPISIPRMFLIKINNQKDISKIFDELNDHLLIEFGVFNKNIEKDFLHHIDSSDHASLFDFIKNDDQYLIYGIDCDNEESSTGIMELISYGINTPQELLPIN